MWVKSFLVGGYHPWKCFFRHFLCCAFLAEPVERVFSFSSIGASTLRRLPAFYHQVLAAWLLMEQRDNLEQLTSRIAYRPIQPVVTHRCQTKFATYHLDWPALWCDLDLYFVNKPIWKTNFLIIHGILPTVDRLARWGIEPRNRLCHCGEPETQEHLYEHCPLTLILIDWFEELLGRKWPTIGFRTHTSGLVIQSPLGFRPDSSFSWQLCDITFGSLGICGNLRVLNQIPKCWSRRSSLVSGLSRRYNSEFFDQRFTRKNGSLGECCSLCRRSLVALVPASALQPSVVGLFLGSIGSVVWEQTMLFGLQ